ncbi:hypothetical protein KCP78_18590 [Salmonella enterica subsp. enterica]|nr:hypothetical protein KCP78_18590 [Salmonella enterica subsp. enterica]
MDWSTAREPLASLFYNRKHHNAKQQHAVERTRELFAKSPGYDKTAVAGRLCHRKTFSAYQQAVSDPRAVLFAMPRPAMINTSAAAQTGARVFHRPRGNTGLRIKFRARLS